MLHPPELSRNAKFQTRFDHSEPVPNGATLNKTPFKSEQDRDAKLTELRNLKMAKSSHRYVRGSTQKFYKCLENTTSDTVPTGPPIWICGDCHVGNLGPIANAQGHVEIQIRDFDQTVIGNPAHDLLRLALSLASAARGSDLPGVATFTIIESILQGYELAFAPDFDVEADIETPPQILAALRASIKANWSSLAKEKIADKKPTLPMGEKFWPLHKSERADIKTAAQSSAVHNLVTMLKSRPDEGEVKLLDAAYWIKGCSSLGKLRYAAVLSVAGKKKKSNDFCLLDFKQASAPLAPRAKDSVMPKTDVDRVIEGAKHLSPYLGKRMVKAKISNTLMFVRELLPQDLKLDIEQLNAREAAKVAAYLAAVVGKAHSRQLNPMQRKEWLAELKKQSGSNVEAPTWLWRTIVELLGVHEQAYLDHCRRHALLHHKTDVAVAERENQSSE